MAKNNKKKKKNSNTGIRSKEILGSFAPDNVFLQRHSISAEHIIRMGAKDLRPSMIVVENVWRAINVTHKEYVMLNNKSISLRSSSAVVEYINRIFQHINASNVVVDVKYQDKAEDIIYSAGVTVIDILSNYGGDFEMWKMDKSIAATWREVASKNPKAADFYSPTMSYNQTAAYDSYPRVPRLSNRSFRKSSNFQSVPVCFIHELITEVFLDICNHIGNVDVKHITSVAKLNSRDKLTNYKESRTNRGETKYLGKRRWWARIFKRNREVE